MKKIILVAIVVLGLPGQMIEAQNTPPVGVFTTIEACEASSANYTPSFLSGHKPLTEGEVLVTLPQRQCGEMVIAGGRMAIVSQAAGTQMVAGPDGRIVRRWDCGNRVRGFIIPTLVPATPVVPTIQSPATAGNVATATASVILIPSNWRPQEDPTALSSFEAYQIQQKKKGFCRSTECKIFGGLLILGAGVGAGYLIRGDGKSKHTEKVTTLPPSCVHLPCH